MLPDLMSALMGGFPNLTSADKGGRGVQNPKKCADIICERPLSKLLTLALLINRAFLLKIGLQTGPMMKLPQ